MSSSSSPKSSKKRVTPTSKKLRYTPKGTRDLPESSSPMERKAFLTVFGSAGPSQASPSEPGSPWMGSLPSPSQSSPYEPSSSWSGQWKPKLTPRTAQRAQSAPTVPFTLGGFDPSPYLHHPFRRRPVSPGRKRDWFDYVNKGNEFEEAWIAVQDKMHDQLFERMAVSMPYLRDAMFYNLNAVVLKKRQSITGLPMFMPAGPLYRLVKNAKGEAFEKLASSKPVACGLWWSQNYFTFVDNGVDRIRWRKEVSVHLGGIFRAVNDEIPSNTIQVNRETLNAIWSFDEQAMLEDWAKTPHLPGLDYTIFKKKYDDTKSEPSLETAAQMGLPMARSTPVAQTKRSLWERLGLKKLKSIYVIHELICAEEITITIKLANREYTYRPPKHLFKGKCFPIGFNMTKYKINKHGYLEKLRDIRGRDCIDYGWNTATNIPWPVIPTESEAGDEGRAQDVSEEFNTSIVRGNLPGFMPDDDEDNVTQDLNELLREEFMNQALMDDSLRNKFLGQQKSDDDDSEDDNGGEITQDLDELLKAYGMNDESDSDGDEV